MVVSIGEILADMIGTWRDGRISYERYAGGAPFNVSCGVKRFGGSAGFVGRVGDDLIGRFLIDYAAAQGFDYLDVTADREHNTTLAFVEIDETGERSFMFYRKNTADYHFDESALALPAETKIVHIGSLMLSEPEGRAFASRLLERIKDSNRASRPLVSFDVNYRDDLFESAEEAMRVYRGYIDAADVVKFSEDELLLFTGKKDLKEAAESMARPNKLICVTLGGKGSAYLYNGVFSEVGSIKVKPVDTTGAGDAFYSAVLSRLDREDFNALSKDKLDEIFRFANVCGALTTTARGAIDALPNLETVGQHLK